MNDKVLDLPKNLGPVEETGNNAGPDEPSFDEVADIDHVGPDIDLVESKETPKLVDGLAEDKPDRKAPEFPDGTSKSSAPDTRTDPSYRDIPTPDPPPLPHKGRD